MARVRTQAVFVDSLLPEGQARWGSFGAGFAMQCFAVALIVIVPLVMPQKLEMMHRYWTTPLETPHIEAWKPQPKPQPVAVKPKPKPKPVEVAKVTPKPEVIVPPKPKVYTPVFSSPVAKPATARKQTKAPDMVEVAKVFPNQSMSLGSSAIPTIRKPREEVQTGGFGDPNGVPDNGKTNRTPNIAQKGSFDLPSGPGYGNGTGGSKGARGIVASTGFGNGVAAPGAGTGNHGAVQSAGFADQTVAAAGPKVKPAAVASNTTPVQILFKPKPVYTDAARAKKIEGEVLLRVVFTASGDVQVEHVVQGLGYGLDESAQAAAREIRFKPAQQGGQPVDQTAIVHIVFQLAS